MRLHDIFKKQDVSLVIMGHEHSNKLWKKDNVIYLTVSGIADKNHKRGTMNSIAYVIVSENKDIYIEFLRVDDKGVGRVEYEFLLNLNE